VIEFVTSLVTVKGGAVWQECYELVLKKIRERLSWTPGSQRAVVMVGDAAPHHQHYHLNTQHIDWKGELAILRSDMASLSQFIFSAESYTCGTSPPCPICGIAVCC